MILIIFNEGEIEKLATHGNRNKTHKINIKH